jgi:hypothetical protein
MVTVATIPPVKAIVMINWTGPALMIAGAILVVFCESLSVWRQQRVFRETLLVWRQQRSLAAMQTPPDNLSSVIGGLEAARIGPEYYDSCL